jgi:histone H3/H4
MGKPGTIRGRGKTSIHQGRFRYTAFAPTRALMGECGCNYAAREAVRVLAEFIEKLAADITVKAMRAMRHRGAGTLSADDIIFAYVEMM